MKLFRNDEVIKYTIFYGIAAAIAAIIGWFMIAPGAGILVLAVCVLFYLVYLIHAKSRYEKMADLAADIDKVLHGGESLDFSAYQEGEFSLLVSELSKLTVRLREQADQLKKEKVKLADSIADISHQIRTPLTAANLIIASLRKTDAMVEKDVYRMTDSDAENPCIFEGLDEALKQRREQLLEMTRLLSRIDWLVSSLLKMAKLDAETVQFFEERILFEDVVKKSIEPLVIPMELKEQELITEINGGFQGDFSWSAEAIGNILKNCMEHTQPGGTLYVTGEENPLYSQLVIRDNGPGIDRKDLPHLFERFYKGKNSDSQSVGIGLALSRMIISRQNGVVKAENHPEGGAMFTIRFYKGTV